MTTKTESSDERNRIHPIKVQTETTQEDFELFRSECIRYQKLWGLSGWELRVNHLELDDDTQAKCCRNLNRRGATVLLNTKWVLDDEEPKTPEAIKSKARHEMIHVLTAPLELQAHNRYASELDLEMADHEVVATLDKLLPS